MNLDGNIELANFVTLARVNGSLDRLRREGYLSSIKYGYDKNIISTYRTAEMHLHVFLRKVVGVIFTPQVFPGR